MLESLDRDDWQSEKMPEPCIGNPDTVILGLPTYATS